MLKNLNLVPGIVFAFILSTAVLPVRVMEGQAKDLYNLAGSQTVIFLLCLACWLWVVYLLRAVRLQQWLKVILSILGCSLLSVSFYYGFNPFFEDFPLDPMRNHSIYVGIRRMSYRGILIGMILYPAAYFLDTQRRLHLQKMRLEQKKNHNLQMELNYLRQQMNPHFLFNALNILKSGTTEPWVKEYSMQLAEIYRYFLDADMKRDLVPVKREIEFIKAYAFILEQRFPDSFEVQLLLTDKEMGRYIPPLSIQLLIENAIKHNVASVEQPLPISVYAEKDCIVVSNPKRKRYSNAANGTGLKNLEERYRLTSDKSISIENEETLFIVKIPLLNHDHNNNRG